MKIEIVKDKRQEHKVPKYFESRNLNYAFYTEYQETAIYLKQENPVLPEKTQALIGKELNTAFMNAANNSQAVQNQISYGQSMCDFYKSLQAKQFSVYVCYPGLLVGTGYPHKTKQVRGEIQMGALFDWATGAPYYPGSSVKGVLRSLFKVASGNSAEADGFRAELMERINNAAPGVFNSLTKKDAAYMKCILFGKDQEDNLDIPDHDTCIFYDAYVVGFRKNASGQQVKILGMDSLAPHEDRLKNPIPINMLRIMPDVCITFNMVLHDVPDKDGNVLITSDQLFTLFKGIILDLGVGAKTHTGYGIVKEIEEPDILFTIPHIKNDQSETVKAPDRQDKEMPGAQKVTSNVIRDTVPVSRRNSDISQANQPDEKQPLDSITCPKCGAEIFKTPDGFIRCKGRCGMVYGRAFREDLSFEEIKQLLLGREIRTPQGRVLSVDLSDSYEAFTTAAGQTKYRLKFR